MLCYGMISLNDLDDKRLEGALRPVIKYRPTAPGETYPTDYIRSSRGMFRIMNNCLRDQMDMKWDSGMRDKC